MTSPQDLQRLSGNQSSGDLEALYLGAVQLTEARITPGADLGADSGAGAAAVLLSCAVFLLSPLILCGNALLLSALYRFKRLRTPSNYLVASLASSDLAVGVLLPVCVYLEVGAGAGAGSGAAALCALPPCLLTALCCASLLVMAAIAVDRFTSLAQPLRYNNLITHRSVERYIACLWLYATAVGFSPLAARLWWYPGPQGEMPSCSGTALLRPPGVALFLVCSVYMPCVVLVVGCYSYVYLVARNHHRAIYSVEISLRHSRDTPSRYTSTLLITVGLFVCLWLPFQAVILMDVLCGYHLLSSLRLLSLSLPMFASSALNPWVYGYRNGEVRAGVHRVLDEMLTKLGLSSPHLRCPHLVTTGADAELNSFASNMRLCTMSASPMRTTLLLLPSTNLPSESNSLSASPCLAPRPALRPARTPQPGDEDDEDPLSPTVVSLALAETVVELRPPASGAATTFKMTIHEV